MQNSFALYLLVIALLFCAFIIVKVIGKVEFRLFLLKALQRLASLKEAKINSGRLAGEVETADVLKAVGYLDALKDITNLLTNKHERD